MRSPIRTEINETLRLTIPLASAQVAQAATGFVDTVMMGWLGQETLAAGGLATTTFSTLLIVASGIVFGISPLVAEAYGASNTSRIQQLTRQGFWLSLLVAVPIILLLRRIDLLMRYLGQAESIITLAKTYLDVIVWGFFPAINVDNEIIFTAANSNYRFTGISYMQTNCISNTEIERISTAKGNCAYRSTT